MVVRLLVFVIAVLALGYGFSWLADRPERFATPWPPEKTARMLRDQGASEQLQ